MNATEKLEMLWQELYGAEHNEALQAFVNHLNEWKNSRLFEPQKPEWYKDAIVYSLYVDLFNGDFTGLTKKLDYLEHHISA